MRQFQTVFVFWLDPWKRWKLFLFYEKSKIRSHKSILFNLPERDNLSLLWLFAPTILVCISNFHSLSLWIVGCWLVFAMSLVLISQSPFPFFPAALFADFTDFLYQLSSALGRLFIDQHYQPRWTWYIFYEINLYMSAKQLFTSYVCIDRKNGRPRDMGALRLVYWHNSSKLYLLV